MAQTRRLAEVGDAACALCPLQPQGKARGVSTWFGLRLRRLLTRIVCNGHDGVTSRCPQTTATSQGASSQSIDPYALVTCLGTPRLPPSASTREAVCCRSRQVRKWTLCSFCATLSRGSKSSLKRCATGCTINNKRRLPAATTANQLACSKLPVYSPALSRYLRFCEWLSMCKHCRAGYVVRHVYYAAIFGCCSHLSS